MSAVAQAKRAAYSQFLVLIAGLGGLLYGIDVGIISAALLYLNKTISLSVGQTSAIVAAVLGGSMCSSPVAGLLSDWLGRKKMMVAGGLLFVLSVVIIVLSQSFGALFAGRLMQGLSGGVIAVVVPLFLAESLPPETRGRGTAIFQFMLTVGILLAALAGWFYTYRAEAAIRAAHGNAALIRAAQDHAWRGMFLSVVYPGLLFFLGSFFLSETPRWLYRRGRTDAALRSLVRSSGEAEAARELAEMREAADAAMPAVGNKAAAGSLLQRRYVLPFVLACIVLACNQTTGINSILAFLVVILRQAGMSAAHATTGDVVVKVLNCVMTVVAVALVDRRGRRFLLKLGTAGVVLSLLAGAAVFFASESRRVDVRAEVAAAVQGRGIELPLSTLRPGTTRGPVALSVLYAWGSAGEQAATVLSTDPDPALRLQAPPDAGAPLEIRRASLAPVPAESTGWLVAACLAMFITAFSIGPGVVVWLMLSELMPTRIRSTGMGIALLLNQGVSTLIAGVFLPVVSRFGYWAMFLFWAACTVVYFVTAAFFLPETQGRTLEEIEQGFTRGATREQSA